MRAATAATAFYEEAFGWQVDDLGFATQNGITGDWDTATGVLTLSGSAKMIVQR